MRSRLAAIALMLALMGVANIGSPAQAQVEPDAKARCGRVKENPGTGVPKWLERCGQVDPGESPEKAARTALKPLASSLGLAADGGDLTLLDVKEVEPATNVRFQQVHKGVPVYLGQVMVKYDHAGEVQLVNNHTLADLDVDVTPQVTAEDATSRAVAEVPGPVEITADPTATLEIYGDGVEPMLAWHVFVPTLEPAGEWHVIVAAGDGAIVAVWDELRQDTGSGLVYDPNAVQQTGNTALVDGADATTATLDSARVTLPMNNLNAGTKLVGSYVDITAPGVSGCNLPYVPGTASEASRVYNYTRADDRFEEATTYAAIDGVQTWFQSLGFTNVNNRSIPVDVHCISADNSYYSSVDKALHLGDGGVDDAEDADITIHEYGHSVHDNQVPGWGPGNNTEQRAMGEGFGDVLAGLYYINKGNAAYMANYKYCIGEWDAVSYNPVVGGNSGSGCLRWINGRNESNGADIGNYPGTPSEEHNDGRFWSAAMTCIFEGWTPSGTARDDVMELILAHHFDLVPDSSNDAFQDSIEALLLEDRNRFAGAHQALIGSCGDSRLGVPYTPPADAPADFDGDGDTDKSVFRPSNNGWYVQGQTTVFHGLSGDIPVPADYNGDGTDDYAVFRPSNGGWYVIGQSPVFHGQSTDIPVPGDYNGDGTDDYAVFRPSVGGWYISGQATVFHGQSGDIPVPGQWDADASDDIAVFRPSVGGWYISGQSTVFHGLNGDVPMPGQYDADAVDDVTVFRPSAGGWYVQGSATQFLGLSGDIPVAGQHDADPADEIAVFRRPVGGWYVPSQATVFFGLPGDVPLPIPNHIYRFFTFA